MNKIDVYITYRISSDNTMGTYTFFFCNQGVGNEGEHLFKEIEYSLFFTYNIGLFVPLISTGLVFFFFLVRLL